MTTVRNNGEDFPLCEPARPGEELQQIFVEEREDGRLNIRLADSARALPAGSRTLTPEEAVELESEGWLSERDFEGICRLPVTGTTNERWMAYRSGAFRVTYANPLDPIVHQQLTRFYGRTFAIEAQELYALAQERAVGLNRGDLFCVDNDCPPFGVDGAVGIYRFVKDPERLGQLIEALEEESLEIDGFSSETRARLLAFLHEVKEKSDVVQRKIAEDRAAQDEIITSNRLSLLISILLVLFIGYQPIKDVIAKIRGRVRFTDFGEVIRRRLQQDPTYDVLGRDAEARLGWSMTDTMGFRHVIFDAPTGEGKEKIVERMIIMKERGDPIVPVRFREAPVLKINAADFQAGTHLRGNVSDKVAEIGARAHRGPVIVYISEIDLVFLSGGSLESSSEVVAKLLLDIVEDPKVRENLIILGTTSRGREMVGRFPDTERRFNWPPVRSFALSEIVDIIDRSVRERMERYYGVTLERPQVELSMRLAEQTVRRARGTPRFDATLKILEDAARETRDAGRRAVTDQAIVQVVEQRSGMTIDAAQLERLRSAELDDLMRDVRPGEQPTRTAPPQLSPPPLPLEAMGGGPEQRFVAQLRNTDAYRDLPEAEVAADARKYLQRWRMMTVVLRSMLIERAGLEAGLAQDGIPPVRIVERWRAADMRGAGRASTNGETSSGTPSERRALGEETPRFVGMRIGNDGTAVLEDAPAIDGQRFARRVGEGLTRNVETMALGGIPFGIGLVGSDLVTGDWEALRQRSFVGFAKEYAVLSVGGGAGTVAVNNANRALSALRLPSLPGFLNRGVPLFAALATLELVHRGEIDPAMLALGGANILAATGVTRAGVSLLGRSRTIVRIAEGLRLVRTGAVVASPESGGLTLLGACLLTVADFTILKGLATLEEDFLIARAETALREGLLDAGTPYGEMLSGAAAGDETIRVGGMAEAKLRFDGALQAYAQYYDERREMIHERMQLRLDESLAVVEEEPRSRLLLDGVVVADSSSQARRYNVWKRRQIEEEFAPEFAAIDAQEEAQMQSIEARWGHLAERERRIAER